MAKRLIYAEDLMEKLNVFNDREHGNEHFLYGIETAKELLEDTPTAYDVEKVIMNLRCDTNCPNCSPYCADASICGFDECLKQAIEIVRKGGVE